MYTHTSSSYYGDESNKAFYSGGPSQKKLKRNDGTDMKKYQQSAQVSWIPTTNHHRVASVDIHKIISGNARRGNVKSKTTRMITKSTPSERNPLAPVSRTTSRTPKTPTMPQPIFHLGSQTDSYLVLIEGCFPNGVTQQDYLANVYDQGKTATMPSIGRAHDIMHPTKLAAGPWIVISSKDDTATLSNQCGWSGQRIRFASPKAATTLALQHSWESKTPDTLGSLTVAAFSGFSASEEYFGQENELVQKILQLNKEEEWSKPMANLPSFQLGQTVCSGGFSIAVNLDPKQDSYYLKIDVCEASQEIVCVERRYTEPFAFSYLTSCTVIFSIRSKQSPSSASKRELQCLRRNLKRHMSSERVSTKKKPHIRAKPLWKFDIETVSIPSPQTLFHSSDKALPKSEDSFRAAEDVSNVAIDFDNPSKPIAHLSTSLKDPSECLKIAWLPQEYSNETSQVTGDLQPAEHSPAQPTYFHDAHTNLSDEYAFDVQGRQSEEQGYRSPLESLLKALVFFCFVVPYASYADFQFVFSPDHSFQPAHQSDVSILLFADLFSNSGTFDPLDLNQPNRSSNELGFGREQELTPATNSTKTS